MTEEMIKLSFALVTLGLVLALLMCMIGISLFCAYFYYWRKPKDKTQEKPKLTDTEISDSIDDHN